MPEIIDAKMKAQKNGLIPAIPDNILTKVRICRELALAACPTVMAELIKLAYEGERWAIKEVLDRGLGKPGMSIDIAGMSSDNDKNVSDLTSTQVSMLANNKIFEFLTTMYQQGKLQEFIKRMDEQNPKNVNVKKRKDSK